MIGRIAQWRPKTRFGKAATAFVGGAFLIVVLWFAASVVTEKQLADEWAVSERFGLTNDVQALMGPPVPNEENAAVPLQTMREIAKRQCMLSKKNGESEMLSPERMIGPELLIADPAYESAWREFEGRPKYRTLADLSRPLVHIDSNPLFDLRYLGVAESAIVRWLQSNGRKEEAVLRLLRMARLWRKFSGKEPIANAAIISTNYQLSVFLQLNSLLRSPGRLSASVYETVDAEVALHENVTPTLLFATQVEKLAYVPYIRERGPCGGLPFMAPYSNLDQIGMLQDLNQTLTNLTMPPGASFAAEQESLKRQEARSKDWFRRAFHPLSNDFGSASSVLRFQKSWVAVLARCTRIVNAMAKKNDFNADLKSLGLPADCSIDLFDGKPLRVKRTPTGPIIYSIGFNMRDDGGVIGGPLGQSDIGLGPPEEPKK